MDFKAELVLVLRTERVSDEEKGKCRLFVGILSDTDLFQDTFHYLGAVVDGKNNISHANGRQGFDLVENHGLVGEFNKWLGHRESLW